MLRSMCATEKQMQSASLRKKEKLFIIIFTSTAACFCVASFFFCIHLCVQYIINICFGVFAASLVHFICVFKISCGIFCVYVQSLYWETWHTTQSIRPVSIVHENCVKFFCICVYHFNFELNSDTLLFRCCWIVIKPRNCDH